MSDRLTTILTAKAAEVAAAKAVTPQAELVARCADRPGGRGFAAALRAKSGSDRLAVIAETKRASPSAGAIVANYDPAAIARRYSSAGAACLSVLTEREFFAGAPEHLAAARNSCALPALRKDFIIDPWQVYETRLLDADCMLLIAAALAPNQLAELTGLGQELGLDVLIEVHAAAEVDAALAAGSPLLGINNRNLATLATDLETTEQLAPLLRQADNVLVSESAIGTPADAARVLAAGVDAILVGEALLRAVDPEELLRQLMRPQQDKLG